MFHEELEVVSTRTMIRPTIYLFLNLYGLGSHWWMGHCGNLKPQWCRLQSLGFVGYLSLMASIIKMTISGSGSFLQDHHNLEYAVCTTWWRDSITIIRPCSTFSCTMLCLMALSSSSKSKATTPFSWTSLWLVLLWRKLRRNQAQLIGQGP